MSAELEIGRLLATAVTTVPELATTLTDAWVKSNFKSADVKKEISQEILSTNSTIVTQYISLLKDAEKAKTSHIDKILQDSSLSLNERAQLIILISDTYTKEKKDDQLFILKVVSIPACVTVLVAGIKEVGKVAQTAIKSNATKVISTSYSPTGAINAVGNVIKIIKH